MEFCGNRFLEGMDGYLFYLFMLFSDPQEMHKWSSRGAQIIHKRYIDVLDGPQMIHKRCTDDPHKWFAGGLIENPIISDFKLNTLIICCLPSSMKERLMINDHTERKFH